MGSRIPRNVASLRSAAIDSFNRKPQACASAARDTPTRAHACGLRLNEDSHIGVGLDGTRVQTRPLGATAGRRGLVLIAVMVCLAVVTLLCGVLLKLTLSEQRQARVQERRLQAEWLAESGIERAAAKLRDSREYTGETWEPAAVELAPGTSGVITIEVERVEGQPDLRLVRVRADLLQDGVRQGRHSKEVQVKLKTSPSEVAQ